MVRDIGTTAPFLFGVRMIERWPEPMPRWPGDTPMETVLDWEWERCCVLCFKGLCEWCEGGPSSTGLPCICGNPYHTDELAYVE